jgi:multidrug resistance protein, MATE family
MKSPDNSARPDSPNHRAATGWSKEFRATLSLAWPLVLSQLATVAMSTTDVIMMGWLGPLPLAAGTLGSSVIFPLAFFGIGLLTAVAAMCAQELGARRYRGVRRTVRQGLWISAMMTLPFTILVWNGEDLLILMNQDPEIAALSQAYLRSAVWLFFPGFVFIVLRNFISAHGRPRAALIVTVLAIVVNGFADYALIFGKFGFPRWELFGAGLATSIMHLFMAVALIGFVLRDRRFRRYWIFARFWKSDWPRFLELLKIGVPAGFMTLAEAGLFAIAAFLIGQFGAAPLAGHAVALQCSAVTFMIPLGISQAATVRVGLAWGRGDESGIGRAGLAALALGVLVMVPAAASFWLFGRELTGLYLDLEDPSHAPAIGFAVSYLAVAAVFQLVDSGQVISAGALRGLNDTRVPMVFGMFCYLGLGFGAAWLLAFRFDYGGVGVWSGLAIGLAAACVALVWRFLARRRLGLTRPRLDRPARAIELN